MPKRILLILLRAGYWAWRDAMAVMAPPTRIITGTEPISTNPVGTTTITGIFASCGRMARMTIRPGPRTIKSPRTAPREILSSDGPARSPRGGGADGPGRGGGSSGG
jgi:hypothetical protein